MECNYCDEKCIKAGKQKNDVQKYYCKACKKYQQKTYRYNVYNKGVKRLIPKLVCNSVGIRGIARVLSIAINTVVTTIKKIAASISKPPIVLTGKTIEVDELRTYEGSKPKECWVCYAMCSSTKAIINVVVGRRTKENLQILLQEIIASNIKRIRTDGLQIYSTIIPKHLHSITSYGTNHIERKNLCMRTQLKRLGRKTICFTKSAAMLLACLIIYFWHV